jgi:hypothetical protein
MKRKIVAVLLVVALAASLGIVPMGTVLANSDVGVGPIVTAPNGTIFAAVCDGTNWMVKKSNYGGHTWNDTALRNAGGEIVQIVVSPNYMKDKAIYVAVCDPPRIYRVTGYAVVLPYIYDSEGHSPSELYSIDVFFDGEHNWVLAGTDLR